jgi:hypothetical protein
MSDMPGSGARRGDRDRGPTSGHSRLMRPPSRCLPRACGRLLRRTVLTVSCQPSLEARRSERHLVFPTCVRKSVDHFQGGVITPLHLLGRRGIRPRFSDQDVGLILVASIEHS